MLIVSSFKLDSFSLCSIACLFSSFFNYELKSLQTRFSAILLLYWTCNIIGRLSVENLGLWNFTIAWSRGNLSTSPERTKLTLKGRVFWHFNTVNNKNWSLVCVDLCFHPVIFNVVLHLKSLTKGVCKKKNINNLYPVACKHLYARALSYGCLLALWNYRLGEFPSYVIIVVQFPKNNSS